MRPTLAKRPTWRSYLALLLALIAIPLAGRAAAQDSGITQKVADEIQDEASWLLESPRVAAKPVAEQRKMIERYVLNAFAQAAGYEGYAESRLSQDQRDHAQRVIGAVLDGAGIPSGTYPARRTRQATWSYPSYYYPANVVYAAPRYVVYAAPPPPPVILIPAPSPVYVVSPAPAYVVPGWRHKHGR